MKGEQQSTVLHRDLKVGRPRCSLLGTLSLPLLLFFFLFSLSQIMPENCLVSEFNGAIDDFGTSRFKDHDSDSLMTGVNPMFAPTMRGEVYDEQLMRTSRYFSWRWP